MEKNNKSLFPGLEKVLNDLTSGKLKDQLKDNYNIFTVEFSMEDTLKDMVEMNKKKDKKKEDTSVSVVGSSMSSCSCGPKHVHEMGGVYYGKDYSGLIEAITKEGLFGDEGMLGYDPEVRDEDGNLVGLKGHRGCYGGGMVGPVGIQGVQGIISLPLIDGSYIDLTKGTPGLVGEVRDENGKPRGSIGSPGFCGGPVGGTSTTSEKTKPEETLVDTISNIINKIKTHLPTIEANINKPEEGFDYEQIKKDFDVFQETFKKDHLDKWLEDFRNRNNKKDDVQIDLSGSAPSNPDLLKELSKQLDQIKKGLISPDDPYPNWFEFQKPNHEEEVYEMSQEESDYYSTPISGGGIVIGEDDETPKEKTKILIDNEYNDGSYHHVFYLQIKKDIFKVEFSRGSIYLDCNLLISKKINEDYFEQFRLYYTGFYNCDTHEKRKKNNEKLIEIIKMLESL